MTGRQQGILLGRGNSELSCGLTSRRESHVWDKWGEGSRAWYGKLGRHCGLDGAGGTGWREQG